MKATANAPTLAPEPTRERVVLTVNHEHLLAQIAQGLLTAHARLDVMEDRLKEVTTQAIGQALPCERDAIVSSVHSSSRDLRAGLEKSLKEGHELILQLERTVSAQVQGQSDTTRRELGQQLAQVQVSLDRDQADRIKRLQDNCAELLKTTSYTWVVLECASKRHTAEHKHLVWAGFWAFCSVIGIAALPLFKSPPTWLPYLCLIPLFLSFLVCCSFFAAHSAESAKGDQARD